MLNLDLISNGATIGEMIDTINKNNNAIMEFGGGPQGPVNNKSLPGLPGLGGKEGLTGLAGDNGSTTSMIDEDPLWNVDYGPSIVTGAYPWPNATVAINNGAEIGDKWVDNLNGVFYSISDAEEFVSYPIAQFSSSEFWIANPDSGSKLTGTRYSSDKGTVTITSLESSTPDESAGNNDPVYAALFVNNGLNYGNTRDDFKFSIDAFANASNISTTPTIFDIPQSLYSPLFYLGDADPANNTGTAEHFGLFLYTDGSGSDNQILSINNSKGVLYADTLSTGTKNEFFTVASGPSTKNRVTMADSDGATIFDDSEFWFSISRLSNTTPAGDIVDFDDMGGMRIYNPSNGGSPTLEIEFYTHSDTTDNTPGAWDKVMAINSNRSVNINTFLNPTGTLTVGNTLTQGGPTDEYNASHTFAIQTPDWGANTGQGGTQFIIGYGSPEGLYGGDNWEGHTYMWSEYRSNTLTPNYGVNAISNLILQPVGFATGNVGIGAIEPNAKLEVDGNVGVGTNQAPPTNGLIVGGDTRFGVGAEPSTSAIASVRSAGNMVFGDITSTATSIEGVSIGLNTYTNAAGEIVPHTHVSNENYGGRISVTNSFAGTPPTTQGIGISLTTSNSNNAGATTEGQVLVSGKKETMGYFGVGQTVPLYKVDIATTNNELQGLHIGNNDTASGGVAFLRTPSTFTAGVGNGTDGPHLLIKNLEIQDIGFVQGGGPNDFYKGQKNIILETTYSEFNEGGPTITDLAGSVIVKTEPDNSLVIDSDFDKNTMMQILHSASYHRHGLLIQGNDGNHLHLRGGQTNDTFFTSGGIGLNDETFKIKGSGEVTSEDEMNAVAFNTTSDKRFKENIEPLSNNINSLETLSLLKPVSFDWKDKENETKSLGLIAQDVLNILPEVVKTTDPDKLKIDYSAIIPLLINAINELNAEIKTLKNK